VFINPAMGSQPSATAGLGTLEFPLSDLLNCAVNPVRRRFRICRYLCAQRLRQPCPKLRDYLWRNLLLPKRLEGLDDQTTVLQFDSRFLERRMLEDQGSISNLVNPVRPVR